jgi:hypothetical protein
MNPEDTLTHGCKILDAVLLPQKFKFHMRGAGRGSGGNYAWGEYVRDGRRLEIHFRESLGLVRYHSGSDHASHEAYMKQLGVWSQCHYPGFSSDPMHAFVGLAHDLKFAGDFLSGDAGELKIASGKEAASREEETESLMAGYVGDTRAIEQIRVLFKQGRYAEVVSRFNQLKYPTRLNPSEMRIVEMARERQHRKSRP